MRIEASFLLRYTHIIVSVGTQDGLSAVGVGVPDGGLTRPKKLTERKKYLKKKKKKYYELIFLFLLLSVEVPPPGWKTSTDRPRNVDNIDFNLSSPCQQDGWNVQSPQVNIYLTQDSLAAVFLPATKLQNRLQRAYNGNGNGNQVSLIHWNMGPKYWSRKFHDIEVVTQQYSPDIFSISEANLLHNLTDYEKNIPG